MERLVEQVIRARSGEFGWDAAANAVVELSASIAEAPFKPDGLQGITPAQAFLEEVSIGTSVELLRRVTRGMNPSDTADNVAIFLTSLQDRLKENLPVTVRSPVVEGREG